MLKSVAFKNYIHFKEHMELKFEPGSSFIIGANSSGKSSIFELIRRCLSIDVNTSTSRVYNQSEGAYACCKYEISECNGDEKDIGSKLENKIGWRPKQFDSYIFTLWEDKHREIHHKIVVVKQDGHMQVYLQTLNTENGSFKDTGYKCKVCNEAESVESEIESLMKTKINKKLIQPLLDKFENDNDQIINKLLAILTDSVVLTLPMRAIGSIQWSKSDKIRNDKKEGNYSKAMEEAEILRELLDSPDVDQTEGEMFTKLTRPADYKFEKEEDGSIKVTNFDTEPKSHPKLLKVSEGLIEAKQLTLLLSHKYYLTLCLEEPDKGMHPQMIEKMRDLILRTIKNKTVLVISHQTTITSPWTMSRTFVCRRKTLFQKESENREVVHQVMQIKNGESPHFLAEEEMKKISYAENVLAVEGPTDSIVIKAIFERVLEGHPKVKESFPDLQTLQEFVSSLHVIIMNGFKNKSNTENLCSRLKILGLFLLDRNTVVAKRSDTFGFATAVIHQTYERMIKEKEKCTDDLAILKQKLELTETRKKTIIYNLVKFSREERSDDHEELYNRKLKTTLDMPCMKDELDSLTRETEDELLKSCLKELQELNNAKDVNTAAYYFLKLFISPPASRIQEKTIEEYKLDKHLKQLDFLEKESFDILNAELASLEMPIFVWRYGNLESLINNAIMLDISKNIKAAGKYWKRFPIMKDNEKEAKTALRQKGDEEALRLLSECLLYDPEVKRFLKLLIQTAKSNLI